MLVDFLKGNHLTKVLATVPWLWAASRESSLKVINLGLSTTRPQVNMGVWLCLLVGPGPAIRPGGCLRDQDWHLAESQELIRLRAAAEIAEGNTAAERDAGTDKDRLRHHGAGAVGAGKRRERR
jgi:hypothetical protein